MREGGLSLGFGVFALGRKWWGSMEQWAEGGWDSWLNRASRPIWIWGRDARQGLNKLQSESLFEGVAAGSRSPVKTCVHGC